MGTEVFGPCQVLSVDIKSVVARAYTFNKSYSSEVKIFSEGASSNKGVLAEATVTLSCLLNKC